LAVFSGNAHLERGSGLSLDMHGGESVALSAANPSQYNLAESIEPDSWDTWNSDRDQVLTSEAASRTAATNGAPDSGNPAWNDLDANGNWYDVPGQGYVWSPYDASNPGWDPYGNGYWMWNPSYGDMWISGDAGGYLPFSCGMWNFYGGFGWGWSPGIGGCSPWWSGGAFITNVGYGPPGYAPPRMPHRPPIRRGGTGPIGRKTPLPLVVVNRRAPGGYGLTGPRVRNVSATIAGHVVMPLRPVSPRPVYERSVTTGSGGRFDQGGTGNGFRGTSTGPGSVAPGQGYRPATPRAWNGASSSPMRQQAPAARPAAAPAPHFSPPPPSGGGAHVGGGGGGSPHH